MFEAFQLETLYRLSEMFLPAIGDVFQHSPCRWNARHYCKADLKPHKTEETGVVRLLIVAVGNSPAIGDV